MTMVGLFAGTAPKTAVGSATSSADGAAGFGAALLGAVAAGPLLFASAASVNSTSPATPASPTALVALVPSEIQENGTAAAVAAPVIAAQAAIAGDQTPELSKADGEKGGKGERAETAVDAKAPVTSKTKKDAGVQPEGAVSAPVVADTPATPAAAVAVPTDANVVALAAGSPAPAIPRASATPTTEATAQTTVQAAQSSVPAAPVAQQAPQQTVVQAVQPAVQQNSSESTTQTTTPPTTVMVGGVAVELVVTSVAEKPAVVKPAALDVSSAAAAVVPAAPAAASGVASAAPASAPTPNAAPTFTDQLAKPLFTLAAAPNGDHIVTVKVTPDNLGPVTVRAHVGAEGMRVELFAPNEAGREAIRSILPDLRKDLAGQGVNANLDLSSQNQPFDRGGDAGTRERGASAQPGRQDAATAQHESQQPARRTHTSTSMLDVMA